MKIILSSIIFFIQVSLFSQLVDSKIIDYSNCRDGENVEYCKTHKLMNKLKKDPEAHRQFLENQLELKKIVNQISNNPAKPSCLYISLWYSMSCIMEELKIFRASRLKMLWQF